MNASSQKKEIQQERGELWTNDRQELLLLLLCKTKRNKGKLEWLIEWFVERRGVKKGGRGYKRLWPHGRKRRWRVIDGSVEWRDWSVFKHTSSREETHRVDKEPFDSEREKRAMRLNGVEIPRIPFLYWVDENTWRREEEEARISWNWHTLQRRKWRERTVIPLRFITPFVSFVEEKWKEYRSVHPFQASLCIFNSVQCIAFKMSFHSPSLLSFFFPHFPFVPSSRVVKYTRISQFHPFIFIDDSSSSVNNLWGSITTYVEKLKQYTYPEQAKTQPSTVEKGGGQRSQVR